MSLFFDDSSPTGQKDEDHFPPLWSIDFENEEEVLKWGKHVFEVLTNLNQYRIDMIREMISRYRGFYYKQEPVVGGARIIGEQKRRKEFPRVITNHLQSLVEQKVAMQVKYKPETEPYPVNQEFQDKVDAICAKKFLQDVKQANKVDLMYPRFVRRSIITGQSFFYPRWDEFIGPFKKKGERVETRTVKLQRPDGSEFSIDAPERRGDIRISMPKTDQTFLFPTSEIEDCPGVMLVSQVNTWELRARYPDLSEEIKPTDKITNFNYNSLEEDILANHTLVLTFYLRSNPISEQGFFFRMTPDVVLDEVQDNPMPAEGKDQLELGNIPLVRLTDVEFDFDINGYPSVLNIARTQELYDNLTTQFAMNVAMYCHPKWKFQKNSCNIQQLANIPGLYIEYTSDKAPELDVVSALTQDQFIFRDSVLANEEKTFGVYSVSRGAPPPGTRATSQLYFYDEQEAQLNAPFKRKFDSCVEGLDSLLLSLMAEHYVDDKERVVWILGRDNKWMAETLDVNVLKKRYVVKPKVGSSLPDNKSARLNALFELYQMNPNQMTWEQIIEALDFGQQEKYIDYARVCVMAAESENERMMNGEEVESPERYELHVPHLKVHYKLVSSAEFKQQSKKTQEQIIEHVGTHEMLAMDIAAKNPIFAQQLQMFGQFPVFALEPIGNPEQPPVLPMPAQAANPVGRPREVKGNEAAAALGGPPEGPQGEQQLG